jgi:hypothetical protein
MANDAPWSNTPGFDGEAGPPTKREKYIAKLAAENDKVEPQLYNITSKNAKAMRVIYDFDKQVVSIEPGATKQGVLLHPKAAEYLNRTDLEVVQVS